MMSTVFMQLSEYHIMSILVKCFSYLKFTHKISSHQMGCPYINANAS